MKRGHRLIKDNLAKLSEVGKENWLKNFYVYLWTDRIIIYISIKVTLFYFNYRYEPIMLIKEEVPN